MLCPRIARPITERLTVNFKESESLKADFWNPNCVQYLSEASSNRPREPLNPTVRSAGANHPFMRSSYIR